MQCLRRYDSPQQLHEKMLRAMFDTCVSVRARTRARHFSFFFFKSLLWGAAVKLVTYPCRSGFLLE